MNELLELAQRGDETLDTAFSEAALSGDGPARDAELLETLSYLASHGQADQAEMLAWTWLTEARQHRSAPSALDLGRRLLLLVPHSAQLRDDVVALYKSAYADRADIADWLAATGLIGSRVSPQRACRALDLALALQPGQALVERTSQQSPDLHQHRVAKVIGTDASAGVVTIGPVGGTERRVEILRLGDDHVAADADDFRLLARRDPRRLKELLSESPLSMLISMISAAGGRTNTDQLRDNLLGHVLTGAEYAKWWSRARTAARKSPHVRIEGRTPTVLTYDPVGRTVEQETADAVAKAKGPAARLAAVETYLRPKGGGGAGADAELLADLARQVAAPLEAPGAELSDALVARRLADLGVPVPESAAGRAVEMLTGGTDIVAQITALDDVALWSVAVDLLPTVFPVGEQAGGPDDWQGLYLRLLAHAPGELCDRMAARLIDAGQLDRLNARIAALVASPLESLDALCWLWSDPIQADRLDMPRLRDVLDQLLSLAKQARAIAATDRRLARRIRSKVRAALSSRDYASFRSYVLTLAPELAPMLRRQIRRAEGLGVILPERMTAILDEQHPPPAEPRAQAALWEQQNVIYVSAEALAAKESELENITHVEMPANAKATAEAASHGDLSENAEYRFALEERDLLLARVARIQNELAMARVLTPEEVPTEHVSIYSQVRLAPVEGGEPVTIQIVSPWDSNVSAGRYNYKAPLSGRLLGKRVGQTAHLALDIGEEREFRIDAMGPPDTAAQGHQEQQLRLPPADTADA